MVERSEGLCTYLTTQTQLIQCLQRLMANGTAEARQKILFILTNILSNSEQDVAAVKRSGITSNIALALNDQSTAVRKEALWAVSTLLHAESDVNWLVDHYELESTLLEFLDKEGDL